jgi:hypothetical protein
MTVALLLAAPSMAFALTPTTSTSALGSGVNPLAPVPTTTTTAPPVVTNGTTTAGGTVSGSSTFVIAAGAVVILAGISFFIWHDARRRAPVRDRVADANAAGDRVPGSKRVKPRKLSPAERRRRKRGRAKPRR